MLVEILGLGMPVAASFGWWVGRKNTKAVGSSVSLRYSLNHSMLDISDGSRSRSIVEELHRLNPTSVDLRFALAALYREQGDYSQAVEMHESILNQKQLQTGLYARVSIELARDYLSAGILDRAEGMLHRLVNKQLLMKESLRLLLDIYEQTKEWSKAIVVAKRLRYQGQKCDYLIAQYNCELAQSAVSRGQAYAALMHYQHACLVEPNCTRANIGIARFYQQRKEYVKAICHYRNVFDNHPVYLSLIVDPLYYCFCAIGRSNEFIKELQANTYYRSSVSVAMVIVKHIDKNEGRDAALACVDEELSSSASLELLHVAVMWSLHDTKNNVSSLRLWQEVLERNLDKRPVFSCKNCGYHHDQLYWKCDACGEWARIVPLLDEPRVQHFVEKPAEQFA